MKNKLHTTVCHSAGVSRYKQSHSIFYVLFSILLTLLSIPTNAQPYEWDWAIYGGSDAGANYWRYDIEQVYDVVVGSDDNYYYLASINRSSVGSAGTQLAGQQVTVYNSYDPNALDIFLFSTTCDGQVRWSQAIGGGGHDSAYKIALDSNNNVYVGANVDLGRKVGITDYPVHFSPTESLPMPPPVSPTPGVPGTISDGWKRTFLVKYTSNGQFDWKRALQGDVRSSVDYSHVLDVLIDSKDNIHFIIGLTNGTHLDNKVNVPAQYKYDSTTLWGYIMQYYVVKYNTLGQYISSMGLPIADGSMFFAASFTFKYDEPRNRYYIAGFRSRINVNENIPLTYAGTAFTKNAYILAIDAGNAGEIWRREMEIDQVGDDCRIYDLVVDDTNGDVYIGGKLSRGTPNTFVKIINPKNPVNNPYNFVFDLAGGNMPFIAKLNSGGTVQWARTPSDYNSPVAYTGMYYGFGMALRYNEVAFATMGGNTVWDGFSINRPQNHKSDPMLMRFNKQTGAVIGMHDIQGSAGNDHMLTAVAVDNDGNYVVGGSYYGNLFTDRAQNQWLGYIGKHDFFVAKLAASVCGTAVSTDKFNKLSVNVYPNPTNDIINIETDETLLNYVVYDMNGREIQNGMFGSSNQLNLHGTTAGTYFIKVTTTQGSTATVKVIKK